MQLAEKAAETVHNLFPFLTPDQFQRVAQLMKEGHAPPLAELNAIHPQIGQALFEHVVDAKLKPYFDSLMGYVPTGYLYAGFKLVRKEEGESASQKEAAAEAEREPQAAESDAPPQEPTSEEPVKEAASSEPEEEQSILHWFFFPLAGTPGAAQPSNLVAWEATSTSGRATYFFRLLPPEQASALADPAKAPAAVEAAIQKLNRALVLLNFRREPIYLSDDKLEIQLRYRRYAIACRKIPELRLLRASFLGRAIHTSPTAWQKQVEGFLTATK